LHGRLGLKYPDTSITKQSKTMKKVLFLMSLAAIFVACGGNQKKENATSAELTVDQIMENAGEYVDKTVTAVGIIDHVCTHGGDKMFMINAEGTSRLKVVPSGDLQAFTPEMEGTTLAVSGTLEEMRITNEYLDNWEKEEKNKHDGHGEGEHNHSGDGAEAHEGGHHNTAHGEKADMGEHKAAASEIAAYREKIAASEKGYLSFYTLNATKIESVEGTEKKVEAEIVENTENTEEAEIVENTENTKEAKIVEEAKDAEVVKRTEETNKKEVEKPKETKDSKVELN